VRSSNGSALWVEHDRIQAKKTDNRAMGSNSASKRVGMKSGKAISVSIWNSDYFNQSALVK
jgi:hypothetical protein